MAFTPEQVEEFIATLQQDAALRDRVRNAILADDFLALPGLVARLADETAELTIQVKGLLWQMNEQVEAMRYWSGETANIKGQMYEFDFERKLSARIGRRFRQATATPIYDIEQFSAAMESGVLSPDEVEDAARLDIVASARDVDQNREEVLVAIEVSVVVDPTDVLRAVRRAGILTKCGLKAIPLVGGESITREARDSAEQLGVVTAILKRDPAA